MISLGGAMGGFFNALIAPLLFTWVAEYPLGLALAAFLVPAAGDAPCTPCVAGGRPAGSICRSPCCSVRSLRDTAPRGSGRPPAWFALVPLAACLLFVRRPLRFALGLAVVAMVAMRLPGYVTKRGPEGARFLRSLAVSVEFPARAELAGARQHPARHAAAGPGSLR